MALTVTTPGTPGERVLREPIAAPSILGLFGFAGATFMVAAHLAGWYGDARTPQYLFPFAAMFGGLAQFLAGMWAYKARDGLGTAMHGTWGAFWLAYGILYLMVAAGALQDPDTTAASAMGFWFAILAAVTWAGAFASLATNVGLVSVLALLAAGSTLLCIGDFSTSDALRAISGYVLMASAVCAWYTAAAMMIEGTFGREVLPLGKATLEQHTHTVVHETRTAHVQ